LTSIKWLCYHGYTAQTCSENKTGANEAAGVSSKGMESGMGECRVKIDRQPGKKKNQMTKKKFTQIAKSKSGPAYLADLRKKAQKKFRAEDSQKELSPKETRNLLHELRVHQIELEMQNDELRRTQAELESARASYFDLYNLAPVGYVVVSEQGLLLEANLTAAVLLGSDRGALVRQPFSRFIFKEDQDIYYLRRKKLFETGETQRFELRMLSQSGNRFWMQLDATLSRKDDRDAAPVCRIVLSDIRERKLAEEARRILIVELESALARVKTLSGLLPICAGCKKIRDDQGYWGQVETYIQEHSEARFTHSMCPECMERFYPKLEKDGGKAFPGEAPADGKDAR